MMKKYWVVLTIVVIVGISIPIIIMNTVILQTPKLELVYLNTDSMREAGNGVVDSTMGPAIVSIFPCNKTNTINDTIPWANVFVCKSFTKTDSLSGDTIILLLDINTQKDFQEIKDPAIYWAGIKQTRKFNKCKILIPANEVDKLKKMRYKYSDVKLITDD